MAGSNVSGSSRQSLAKIKGVGRSPKHLTAILFLLVSTSLGFLGGWLGSGARQTAKDNVAISQQVVTSESRLISDIAKELGPSVVSINTVSQGRSTGALGFGQIVEQQSAGTGFILNAEGLIITNRHVVPKGTTSVAITLADGTELDDIDVVGRTAESDSLDIAFLKVNDAKGKSLVPVKLGDSAKMQVGDRVIAIGNALGQFQNTVTSGIISGYGRNVEASDAGSATTETLQNLFQTDAAINQGNSGGPLVNISGEVIGINTAIAGDAQSIGFAIPINDAMGLIKSVEQTGKLERPYLGVRYISLTDDYAYQYDLDTNRGAYIVPSTSGQPSILNNSPAAKSGLKEEDIITKVGATKIDETNSLTSVLGRYSVGDKVTLTILRGGEEMTLEATLEASPEV